MSPRWRPRSVRVRLTLWHLAALAGLLILYAIGVFALVRHNLAGDLDRQLQEDFERAEGAFGRNPDGTLSYLIADRDAPDAADPDASGGPWMIVWAPDGRLLYRDTVVPPPLTAWTPETASGQLSFRSVRAAGGAWCRELTGRENLSGVPAIVRVGRSEERVREQSRSLLIVLALGVPVACAFAGFGAYLLARRALAPIDRMAAAARAITAARLGDRLPIDNPDDELGQLAAVFNETFGRLEASFEQLRRFTADASHEMRTPLTAIRTVGEVGLRGQRSAQEYRDIIGSILEEADRLNRLVESLLALARSEGGATSIRRERFDLAEMAAEVVEHLSVLAEDKQQVVVLDAARPVPVTADRVLLRQAFINLLDNAIKYTPEQGRVRVTVAGRSSNVTLAVEDSGPGIAREHVEKIFERFYRIESSRSRDGGGAGLGLSIARWAVEAHGGHIEVEPAQPSGSVFRIVLPPD